jgi:hypothetical protein
MPKYDGVYQDAKGRWYFKVWLGRDPLTGRQAQITKRGFATAADAARARRKELDDSKGHAAAPSLPASLSVNDLLDLYLDGLDRRAALGEDAFRLPDQRQVVRPAMPREEARA